MHIILTGATGLVGSGVLDALLTMADVTRISILSRRPVPLLEDRIKRGDAAADPDRVQVILHKDFSVYDDALLRQLSGAAGVVWALGISQTKVDKEQYYTITHNYPLAFARAWAASTPATTPAAPFNFVYVSGEGATTTPGALTTRFGRVKGETELDLAAVAAASAASSRSPLTAVSVRPSAVDPTGHAAILPFLPDESLSLRIMRVALLPAFRAVWPAMISPTLPLGRFLGGVALGRYSDGRLAGPGVELVSKGDSQYPIVSNTAFRRLMEL